MNRREGHVTSPTGSHADGGPAAGSGASPVRVVVVDDHDMVASGIEAMLALSPEISVVGVALTEDAAFEAVRQHHPDVVVMDYQLGAARSPALFGRLRDAGDGCRILVLTGWASESAMLESFEHGATGFLSKTQPSLSLVDGVLRVAAGEVVVAPQLLSSLAARSMATSRDPATLSRRELDVVELLAAGIDTKTMADTLGLSVNTIRNHIANVSLRLGAHSRLEVVAEAMRRGLISPPAPDDH